MLRLSRKGISYQIELPFPISANRLWRSAASRKNAITVYLSQSYTKWKHEADMLYFTQKQKLRPQKLGVYDIHCVFSSEKRRSDQDGDNLTKCVNDWLQRVDIIHDDCLCERGSWEWGMAPTGCLVTVTGGLYEI